MKLHLFIDTIKMGMYNVIRQAKLEDIPDELGDLFKMLLSVSDSALQSKQCNEPYERLLAEILNLKVIQVSMVGMLGTRTNEFY